MLRKIVSLVSNNRGIREGEQNGVDYTFVEKKEIQEKLKNGDLMQHIYFNDVEYAYEKKDFDELDKLIVLCGSSGSGKDSVMNRIEKGYDGFKDKNVGFLLSVPKTLPLFIDYAKKENIDISTIFLNVSEKERLKRVVTGDILGSSIVLERYDLLKGEVYDKIIVDDRLNVTFSDILAMDKDISEIVDSAKKRVLRDREPEPFEIAIEKLKKEGYQIVTIEGTKLDPNETMISVLSEITSGIPSVIENEKEQEVSLDRLSHPLVMGK